ncbi:hypothetical protein QWY16_03045 [Planococcus shenhongbingii]|uniref:DUF6920 family protein n=1 Tax=Planococcus shenhongbingii TaxID=3058398 RepID=UPI00262B20B1|nr:DUF6544 family protein [Planococcus sp. N016]WKA59143.1 hypothetical protein QWY16_03045 [Planococcus sp. N016]
MRKKVAISLSVVAVAALYKGALWNFSSQSKKQIEQQLAKVPDAEPQKVTEEMLEQLPAPVQKWLENAGIVGKDQIRTIFLRQTGWMRLKPEQQEWTKAEAEQTITTDPPSFTWTVKMNMLPFIQIVGRDSFEAGKAELLIKAAGLFPVAREADNDKTDQSALQRYLMEVSWYPTAAISPYIKWEEIDGNTAKATMDYQGVSGSATYHFKEDGELEKIIALRYKDSSPEAPLVPCVAEIKEHHSAGGIKVPSKVEITWQLEEGDFTWYKFEVHAAEFDPIQAVKNTPL